MKGTAMTVVMGGTVMLASASRSACNFTFPSMDNQEMVAFSCELSASCCDGLQDVDHMALEAKGGGKPQGGKGRMIGDLVGTCGRTDQVELYKCAVKTLPKMAPAGKEGKMRAIIQAKGCSDVFARSGTDGSGRPCPIPGPVFKGKALGEVHGVSTECCIAVNREIAAERNGRVENVRQDAQCGMIGACGKEDQKSIMRFAKGMMKGGGPQFELLEMFNMTKLAPQQMLATILTSGAEDEVIEDEADVTEDDATEDSSPIVTGILGFVAGAAVTGLGVTVLRRSSPSFKDQYNEIVA